MGEAKEVWIGGDVFQNSFCGLISAVQFSNVTMESVEIKEMYDKIKVPKNSEHPKAMYREPSALIIICATATMGYTTDNGVKIIPIGCLRD